MMIFLFLVNKVQKIGQHIKYVIQLVDHNGHFLFQKELGPKTNQLFSVLSLRVCLLWTIKLRLFILCVHFIPESLQYSLRYRPFVRFLHQMAYLYLIFLLLRRESCLQGKLQIDL